MSFISRRLLRSRQITGLTLLTLIFAGSANAGTNSLLPFTTDGCSIMLDGLPGDLPQWRYCCVRHDRDYWLGGSETEREASDAELEQCISREVGPVLAQFVYANVRWGGSPYWLTTYRWGYGWPYWDAVTQQPRGYKTLTDEEQRQADALMPAAAAALVREKANQ